MALYENPWADAAYAQPRQQRQLGRPPKLSERLKYAAEKAKEKSKEAAKKVKKGASKSWNWIKLKVHKKKQTNAFAF